MVLAAGKTWTQTNNAIGVYAEDTWKVTERLTLTLGLRYQTFTPWVEANDQQSNYNFATGQVELANQNGASRALYNGTYGGKDFQPRVGFAYTPGILGGHTVIRGAFTISSYLEGTGTNLRLPQNPPFTPAQINTVCNSVALPGSTTSDGIPAMPPISTCVNYSCFQGAILDLWDPNVQPAIDDQWNLAIQHQFWGDTTFQIGYVGQRATHLRAPFSYTQRVLLPNSACTTPPCTAPSPFFAANPTFYNTIATQTGGTQSNGTMGYNSLQAVLQKEMGRGLQYQVSYTYSKCMSDSTGYYGAWNNALSASAYWQNVYDPKSEWAPCYYDATHVMSAYAVYHLPFGKGKQFASNINGLSNQVIGGWAVSPIVSFRTGCPMPIYGASDNSGTFSRGCTDGLQRSAVHHRRNTARQAGVGGYSGSPTTETSPTRQSASSVIAHRSSEASAVRTIPTLTSIHKDFPITERVQGSIPDRLHQRI